MRITLALNLILLNCKTTNVFILIDSIAPLIDLIYQVFYDITYFMLIFSAFIVLFGFSFLLLSKNIIDFPTNRFIPQPGRDLNFWNKDIGDPDVLVYDHPTSALWYIFMM